MNIPFNTWVFSVPMIIVGIFVAVFSRDTAKRMADMTGYSRKEKAITVSASMSPHLFALLTIFIPLSSNISAFIIGTSLYAAGLTGFVSAVLSYGKTPPETPAAHGTYKISRNPMYVTALMAYTGITVMTSSIGGTADYNDLIASPYDKSGGKSLPEALWEAIRTIYGKYSAIHAAMKRKCRRTESVSEQVSDYKKGQQ